MTWRIGTWSEGPFSVIEVTDHDSLSEQTCQELYLALLCRTLSSCQVIALSQMFEINQGWYNVVAVEDLREYIGLLSHRFSVAVATTSDYDQPTWPDHSASKYVIHAVGPFNCFLLQELLRFSLVENELASIAYGLREIPKQWPLQALDWNRIVVQWFTGEVQSRILGSSVVDAVEWLVCAADGHLWYMVREAGEKDKVLTAITDLAQEHSLELAIEVGRTRL